jgi:ATP-dependent helicase HrpB
MSATLDVAVEYLKKPAREISVWELTVRELQGLLPAHPEGDALVFMPGAYEIMRTVRAARDALGPQYLIFPLHGELPPAD